MYRNVKDQYGNTEKVPVVTIESSYEELKEKVFKGIKDYFIELGRPELLNRIGNNNIIIYNFISEAAAKLIIESQINKVIQNIFEQTKISITLENNVLEQYFYPLAINTRENGGRGIGNIVEEKFINPLSRFICDHDVRENSQLSVTAQDIEAEIIINLV